MAVARLPTLVLIAVLSALLSACGGSGGGSDSGSAQSGATSPSGAETEQSVQVSGYAVKGVVAQGIITAWGVESDGSLVPLGEPARTSETGFYNLSFSTDHELIKLQLTSDGDTRMRCDAVDGCQGYAGSGAAVFGEDFWPGPNLRLETMVAINGNDEQLQGHLTPLTSLSTTLFEVMGTTTGWSGFQQARQQVEAWFGLQGGAVAMIPVDITRELPAGLTVAELESALVNSAFMGLAEQFPVDGVQGAIDSYRNQLLATGEIASEEAGGRPGSDSIRRYAAVHGYELAGTRDQSTADILYSAADRLGSGMLDDTQQPAPQPEETPPAGNHQPAPEPEADEPNPEPAPQPDPETDPQTDAEPAPQPSPDPTPVTGTAKLNWQAPLTREDGTALSMGEIQHYIVRYGNQPEVADMTHELIIEDGQAMEHEITDLGEGTWYFAMRTVDQNGLVSSWSEIASKSIAR
ncbi:hypothetical protein ACFOZ5_13890 [Marinobacter lacisalsi]|uniref:Fibronectin type-III domain-containing protein n=1 Tax=Marinobacter lacisalsi TaxID=475979 RepID=A0ABV8QKF0_9GAMM